MNLLDIWIGMRGAGPFACARLGSEAALARKPQYEKPKKETLGEPSTWIFGRTWDFVSARLTPPPSPKVGRPKTFFFAF